MEKQLYLINFGRRLRQARRDKGLTQEQVAQLLGFNTCNPISLMERGQKEPSLEALGTLAENIKVNLHWLITGEISRDQGAEVKEAIRDVFEGYRNVLLENRGRLSEELYEAKSRLESFKSDIQAIQSNLMKCEPAVLSEFLNVREKAVIEIERIEQDLEFNHLRQQKLEQDKAIILETKTDTQP